jgi:hypothetical protein
MKSFDAGVDAVLPLNEILLIVDGTVHVIESSPTVTYSSNNVLLN